jgi:hypothetical protein
VKEQSHKDEMSAAIRGDFKRLRERGVSATLVPHEAAMPEPEVPSASAEPAVEDDRDADQAPPTSVTEATTASSEPADGEEPTPAHRGWLSRLAGR